MFAEITLGSHSNIQQLPPQVGSVTLYVTLFFWTYSTNKKTPATLGCCAYVLFHHRLSREPSQFLEVFSCSHVLWTACRLFWDLNSEGL